ncbi:multidrug resistance protein 1 [Elysia marginata]|uniref:Multidrug resistance protein 1 n=1 Tax=Elysia marginata TaxID=1093978 RepID=A0AAV4GDN3_9GAST|nr:multidrug resistance protein 1 [Elysia marginata]
MRNSEKIGDQNDDNILSQGEKDPNTKRQLVDNQELPPKYSATNGVNGTGQTPQDGADDSGEDGDGPQKKAPKVGVTELFRFATKEDKLLIYVAVFCSIIHGISYPAMVVLFAKAIELFVNHGKFDRLLDRVPDFLAYYNMSKEHCDDLEKFYNHERLSCDVLDDDFEDVFEEMDIISLQFMSARSGADIDNQGFPSLSVFSPSEYAQLRQALVRCVNEARQTVHESLLSASASFFYFPMQH